MNAAAACVTIYNSYQGVFPSCYTLSCAILAWIHAAMLMPNEILSLGNNIFSSFFFGEYLRFVVHFRCRSTCSSETVMRTFIDSGETLRRDRDQPKPVVGPVDTSFAVRDTNGGHVFERTQSTRSGVSFQTLTEVRLSAYCLIPSS